MEISQSILRIIVTVSVVLQGILTDRCHYVLQNKQGIIKSPNFPADYPNDISCTWLIEAQDGYRIALRIRSFRLGGTSPTCEHDYLLIYDGRNGSGNSFQSPYCGRKISPNFQSTGNSMFLKFTSDSSGTFSGFKIEYKAEKNCNATINSDNGTISSPRYPAGYYSNADCHWAITTGIGTTISLNIEDFQLEGSQGGVDQCYDYVAFYNVIAGRTKLIGLYCGKNAPKIVKSKSNKVKIHFFSDATVNEKGFLVRFSAKHANLISTASPHDQRFTMKSRTGICQRSEFKCTHGVCLHNEKRCNQVDDCGDGADENNCAGSCQIDNGGCAQKCNAHPIWKEYCSCEAGYILKEDKKSCQDVNECADNNGGCSDICSNFAGGYKCECSSNGYQIGADGKTCEDINECLGTLCEHTCENTVGSYLCRCNDGFRATLSGECVDKDECAFGVPFCFDCVNTIGSFICHCDKGFAAVQNATKCEDIDECTLGTHICMQKCENTYGSYKCHCREGYTQNDHRCIDVNECEMYRGECEHFCKNSPGSYSCGCRPGFTLINKTNCLNMNECMIRNSCQHGCTIVNSSFVCTCPDGYSLSSNGKDCDKQSQIRDCGSMQSFTPPSKKQFSDVVKNSWPWVASLTFVFENNSFRLPIIGCIATIISNFYLLTTAHCLHFTTFLIDPSQLLIGIDAAKWDNTFYRAEQIFIHPDYYKRGMKTNADIAIIRLSSAIKPRNYVQPICLTTDLQVGTGDTGFLINWGRLDTKRFSPKLREMQITVQNSSKCAWLKDQNYDPSKMLCTGKFFPKEPCLADSGTPLMVHIAGKWFLAGILVHGAGLQKECSETYQDNAFYNLSYFYPWISKSISKGA